MGRSPGSIWTRLSRSGFAAAWLSAAALLVTAWLEAPENPAVHARIIAPADQPGTPGDDEILYDEDIVASYDTGVAHGPTIAAYDDGTLQAVWFHGRTEAGSDVQLDSARFEGGAWSPAATILSAQSESNERGFHVKTIGNPVLARISASETLLFYVTPSLGGWSTSRISVRKSNDNGRSWDRAVLLRTSPLFNMSTLVRTGAVAMEGGLIGLPVYHELARNFGQLAVIDRDMRVADLRRIGKAWPTGIQPLIVAGEYPGVEAYLRPTSSLTKRVYVSSSADGGMTWDDPKPTSLRNPGSPVCGLHLSDGSQIMAYNDDEEQRSNFSFVFRASVADGWRKLGPVIRSDGRSDRISYCSMAAGPDGRIHMVFSKTADRSIRHVTFSRRWIETNIAEPVSGAGQS